MLNSDNLLMANDFLSFLGARRFGTVLADPPWQFTNKTGKVAPEHKRLSRYRTLTFEKNQITPCWSHRCRKGTSLSLVPERVAPRGTCGDAGVGICVQVQYRLAQSSER